MFSHCTLPSSLQEEPLAPAQHFATVCLCFPADIKKISSNAQPLHNWTGGVILANCPQIQPQLLAPFWLSSFNWFSTARSRVRSFYKFYFEPQGELQGVAYQICVHDCLCTSPQWKRFTNRTWDQYWHNDLRLLRTQKSTSPIIQCFCSVISIPMFTWGQRPHPNSMSQPMLPEVATILKGLKNRGVGWSLQSDSVWIFH